MENLTYQYLKQTDRLKKGNLTCLHPENHNHNDKNPSMTYYSESDKCYCNTCRKLYDIRDFIKYDYNLNDKEAFKKIKEMFNIEYSTYEKERPKDTLDKKESLESNYNFNTALDKALEHKESREATYSYFMARGLTKDIIDQYKLIRTDYFNSLMKDYPDLSNNNKGTGAYFILPFINENNISDYYIGRPEINNPEMKYRNIASLTKKIFNSRYLKNNEEIVFITEGVIDSLSIESVGNYKAISLIGIAKLNTLETLVKDSDSRYILMLDNDKRGIEVEQEIIQILKKHQKEYISHRPFLKRFNLNNTKDSNDMLQERATEFKKLITFLFMEAKERFKPKNEDVNNYLDVFLHRVKQDIYKPIPTHITELDKALGGGLLRQSITTIGGGTSTGKTTLLLQILYNMLQDNKVIYYSLEMSRDQVISKLISHVSYLEDKPLSANELLQGYYWSDRKEKEIIDIINILKERADNLIVKIPERPDIDSILKHAIEFKTEDSAPIIAIDYLQLLQGKDKEDIQSTIKDITRKLKKYVIENDTLAFIITAYNRESTKSNNKVTIESGRDTSDIEYSSDYILGLNFRNYELGYEKSDINDLKNQDKREMTIRILKNRLGSTGNSIDLDFIAKFNTFQ